MSTPNFDEFQRVLANFGISPFVFVRFAPLGVRGGDHAARPSDAGCRLFLDHIFCVWITFFVLDHFLKSKCDPRFQPMIATFLRGVTGGRGKKEEGPYIK
jgi:hypothetical protein